MSVVQEPEVKWTPDQMVEVILNEPDDFLKVRETLTRIGVASRKEKKIYQSCHILHKQGRYYLVHFKELFALDGKHANLTVNDVQRRNRIAQLLADWGLIGIVDVTKIQDIAPLNQIKVLAYKDKGEWILETNVVFGFQNPITLVLIGKDFDLVKWCNILNLGYINNLNQTPVSKQLSNAIASLDIIHRQVCVLAIKGKQFLKMNKEVSTLLV